jgi:hypothetical protein
MLLVYLKEFPTFYGTRKSHFCIRKILLFVPILSQINSIHAVPSCFFKTHFSIILPDTFI